MVWFVTRMKDNAVIHVTKVIQDKTRQRNPKGVTKEQYVFNTNNFTLPASQVALIYKNRWMIKLLFKQINQNFPLCYFWGESENAIKIQIYSVLIAQLLMVVIR